MSKKLQTIETYNRSADALAQKFNRLSRKDDIEDVFSFVDKEQPLVLEIGCGNGRDAEDILTFTDKYIGMDVSEGLLAIAQKRLPGAHFILADIEDFDFPKDVDVIFAFASLIHVPKESFATFLQKAYESLNEGGVVFLSLKHSPVYMEITKEDEFGVRTYWHYSPKDIQDIQGKFVTLKEIITELNGQTWLEVYLQKK